MVRVIKKGKVSFHIVQNGPKNFKVVREQAGTMKSKTIRRSRRLSDLKEFLKTKKRRMN